MTGIAALTVELEAKRPRLATFLERHRLVKDLPVITVTAGIVPPDPTLGTGWLP